MISRCRAMANTAAAAPLHAVIRGHGSPAHSLQLNEKVLKSNCVVAFLNVLCDVGSPRLLKLVPD